MASRVLLFARELRARLSQRWDEKKRIIAEAALAARRITNPPFKLSARLIEDRSVRRSNRERANKTGAALLGRDAREFAQEPRIIGLVARRSIAFRACITCGVNPRRSIERVDLEPGILADRAEAGRRGIIPSLDASVLFEPQAVLDGLLKGLASR